jgi:alkylated DNA repair dioxygenase AlkB
LKVYRGWRPDPGLLAAVQRLFTYGPGEDRATGYLYGDQPWPEPMALYGPELLRELFETVGIRFDIVAFQAYLNGSGCDWHADEAFDVQAILSLGVTRRFGVRRRDEEPAWLEVANGDLLVMPSGFQAGRQHCVPTEHVSGERCSLVFRTRS